MSTVELVGGVGTVAIFLCVLVCFCGSCLLVSCYDYPQWGGAWLKAERQLLLTWFGRAEF
jgi:hypothetical protein